MLEILVTREELIEFRQISGYSLRECEKLTKGEIDASTIHAYEKGIRNITFEASEKLARMTLALFKDFYKTGKNKYVTRDRAKKFGEMVDIVLARRFNHLRFMIKSIEEESKAFFGESANADYSNLLKKFDTEFEKMREEVKNIGKRSGSKKA